jgi:hypothetical protein
VKRATKVILAGVALALLVVAAAATVWLVKRMSGRPPPPPAEVPPAWALFRTSAGHEEHVGKRGIECKSCHDVAHDGFKNPGTAPCVGCHAREATQGHGGTSFGAPTANAAEKSACLACHAFAPKQTMPTCISCHQSAQGNAPAVVTHATAECTTCHVPHGEPTLASKECTTCHDERATEHAKHTGSKGCVDCHNPHVPAREALATCVGCHAQIAATALHIVSTQPDTGAKTAPGHAGHDSCVDCHKPHSFVAAAPGVCIGCHSAKPTLLASTVNAHADCTSCHAPHAPTQAARSCAGCHTGVHVSHDAHDDCIGCHAPHSGDVNRVALPCTTCHANVATTDASAHAGHVTCLNCHAHHDVTPQAKPALCTTCHAREVASASRNAGHSACTTCHGTSTHSPAKAPACGTCHAVEQKTAPPGHQKCTSCHDPHSGERLPVSACASCHKMEAASAHAKVKGGCATCHEAHGPKGVPAPPQCATCHAAASLPGLHTVTAHAECTQCHAFHEPPRSDRATCTTSCHADRRTHQPQAVSCSGCHVFQK